MRSLKKHVLLFNNQGAAVAVSPLLTNLISYWSLEEASGTRNDAHGTNHLTDNNSVTQTTGKVGNAAQFVRANSESLSRTSNASLQAGDIDLTMACWVYLASNSEFQGIAGKWAVSPNKEYMLNYTGLVYQFGVSSDGAAQTTRDATSFGKPLTETWHYVVAWHDATENTINIQVDNGAIDSTSYSSGITTTATTFYLGQLALGYHFGGLIDEVGLWKRVLTSDERTWLYNSGNGRSYADILPLP